MSRKKTKKRNKAYTGVDAAVETTEHVTRFKAVTRSPFGEWWFENKKRVRLAAIISGVGLFIGWLLFELFSLLF